MTLRRVSISVDASVVLGTTDSVSHTDTGVSNTGESVSNNDACVSNTTDGVSNTDDGVSNTEDSVSNTDGFPQTGQRVPVARPHDLEACLHVRGGLGDFRVGQGPCRV